MVISLIINAILIIFLALSFTIILFLYDLASKIYKREGILYRNIYIMQRWLRKTNLNEKFLVKELLRRGYHSLYIYGAGLLGTQLYYALENSEIEVKGFIDRSVNEVGIQKPIYRLNGVVDENVDAVIVTVSGKVDNIIEEIQKQNIHADIIVLDDLV